MAPSKSFPPHHPPGSVDALVRENVMKYQQMLDAIPDLVLVKGAKSKLLWANRAFREYYGMTNEQLRGIIDAPFNEPDYTQQYVKDDTFVFTTGRTLDIPEEPVTRYDGAVRFFHTMKSPILDENGRVIMTIGISRDITEKKAAEAALAEQRARLLTSAKMSALGEMASGIAHEINNPLAIILGKLALLKTALQNEKPDHAKIRDGIEKVETTTLRIARIVKGLRLFSRSADHDPFSSASVSSLINETVELCQERFRNHRIDLQVEVPTDWTIECRPAQISQVILNLLNNSFDAVSKTPQAWVKITALELPDQRLAIQVTDSGTGIPKAIVDRMMEPFFTTKDVGDGTGLGLSISKGIAEEHGGELIYDSNSPHTRFILELPKRRKD